MYYNFFLFSIWKMLKRFKGSLQIWISEFNNWCSYYNKFLLNLNLDLTILRFRNIFFGILFLHRRSINLNMLNKTKTNCTYETVLFRSVLVLYRRVIEFVCFVSVCEIFRSWQNSNFIPTTYHTTLNTSDLVSQNCDMWWALVFCHHLKKTVLRKKNIFLARNSQTVTEMGELYCYRWELLWIKYIFSLS